MMAERSTRFFKHPTLFTHKKTRAAVRSGFDLGLLECIILFASLPYTRALPLTYCICINPSFPASLPEMRFTSFRSTSSLSDG